MGQTLRQGHPNAIAYPAVEVSTLNAGSPSMEAGNLYVTPRAWQPSTLSYVPLIVDAGGNLLVSGGGGGGGAVTISDGSDVAEGSTTDAAVLGDTEGTISAKLRGINKEMALTVGLGIAQFDATSLTQATLTDTWKFYTGGLAGSLVNTVTITYTDSTKATISNVVKT